MDTPLPHPGGLFVKVIRERFYLLVLHVTNDYRSRRPTHYRGILAVLPRNSRRLRITDQFCDGRLQLIASKSVQEGFCRLSVGKEVNSNRKLAIGPQK